MRLWILALLLSLPFTSALFVENAAVGENPVIYGDTIAYEREGSIYVYDLSKREERLISSGSNPSLFGFIVAFETKESTDDLNDDGDTSDVVIQFANVRDRKVTSTKAAGRNPVVFSSFIVFSTKESELVVDFSNDGDLDDDVILQYDIDADEITNLKAIGDYPALNQRTLIFLTEEQQVDTDLNADGDKKDSVLQVFDKDARQVGNTKIVATRPILTKANKAVFVSDGEIVVFDVLTQKITNTEEIGTSPTVYTDVVIFERNGNLFGYSLEGNRSAKINVVGRNPSIFENTVAFVSSEKELGDLDEDGKIGNIIRYAKEEDIDGDDVFDFIDNCPAVLNPEQADSNNDGVGDECEVETPKMKSEPTREIVVENQPPHMTLVEKPKAHWPWILLIVLLLPFAGYFGYKYYKKKQKSFGF